MGFSTPFPAFFFACGALRTVLANHSYYIYYIYYIYIAVYCINT